VIERGVVVQFSVDGWGIGFIPGLCKVAQTAGSTGATLNPGFNEPRV